MMDNTLFMPQLLQDPTALEAYIFSYIETHQSHIDNRDILIGLQYLGYIWDWQESTSTISNIRKGTFSSISVVSIEDTIAETADLHIPVTHSYIANGVVNHNTLNFDGAALGIEGYKHLFEYAYQKGVKGFTSFNTTSGCTSLDTSICTDRGLLSMRDIFIYQGYDPARLQEDSSTWLDINKPLQVYDYEGHLQDITKLFINGFVTHIYKLELDSGDVFYFTKDHKLQLSTGSWVSIDQVRRGTSLNYVDYTHTDSRTSVTVVAIYNMERPTFTVDISVANTNSYLIALARRPGGLVSHNSMQGILEAPSAKQSSPKLDNYIIRSDAPKRPKELPCDVHYVRANGGDFIVLVGKLNGSLYEIFVDDTSMPDKNFNNISEGIIVKRGKGAYAFANNQGEILLESFSTNFAGIYGVLARMVSMSLRHGVPLQFIIDQLQRSKEFLGFEKAVARILKKYIKEGETLELKCPQCGGKMVYKDSCPTCLDCGFGSCS